MDSLVDVTTRALVLLAHDDTAGDTGNSTGNSTGSDAGASTTPGCSAGNDFDGRLGLRISAIFVILVGSLFGTIFPVVANRHKSLGVPPFAFFFAKYFGSGVIVATAFIHLLSPANNALRNPCLTGPITDYDWVAGICLMTIFAMFFVELMAMRYASFPAHIHNHPHNEPIPSKMEETSAPEPVVAPANTHVPGNDHLGHVRDHVDVEMASQQNLVPEGYAAQMTAIFILEFGVIFHSIFIGLTLAVSGSEFTTLYVVLVFHQTFEGLGLGSRLALVPWPQSKYWTPYLLAVSYAISTPIAIAIGLGLRESYPPGSATTLIVNGVFDSISAGILIYTGLVELMAHEFMFSPSMLRASLRTVLSAFGIMTLGAGLMAVLGKWA
ncbi:MAG: hypothetical protein M1829_004492 [Trizodia sp. TS-e1964]|nr:MAG: hypothetical protein M1829_004492 [Trizodia sp. TS-e1964]